MQPVTVLSNAVFLVLKEESKHESCFTNVYFESMEECIEKVLETAVAQEREWAFQGKLVSQKSRGHLEESFEGLCDTGR